MHCGCLFMDRNVPVLGTSTIVQGTIGTIPWYDPLVRVVVRRATPYHNYKKNDYHPIKTYELTIDKTDDFVGMPPLVVLNTRTHTT